MQRQPASEKRGRVHSSLITVAVLTPTPPASLALQRRPQDFSIQFYSGRGAGGQHRNKHQNCARILHKPTNITQTAQTRSRDTSVQQAMAALLERLDLLAHDTQALTQNQDRRAQIDPGFRRRTYAFQHGFVQDHISGKKASLDQILQGHFSLLR